MYSRNHALISLVLAGGIAVVAPPTSLAVLVAVVVGVGVGIDFDHFLVARLNTGSWESVRRCVRDPSLVFLDQRAIFDEGDLTRTQRLLSHALIGGALVGGLATWSPYWCVVTALALYVHVVADLYADVQAGVETTEPI